MIGAGELLPHAAGKRSVVDCKVKPEALVGHVKVRLAPERLIASCGGDGKVRLNIVPKEEAPPAVVVPYRILPDKISPPTG